MVVYFNGQFLEKSQVGISPDDRGFLFADGLYDVIRAYNGRLFKAAAHFERLAAGMKALRICGCDAQTLEPVAKRLLQENGLQQSDATVYVQVTRGAAPRSHRFPPANTPPTVYIAAKPFTPPVELQQNGARAIVVADERWGRCDLKTIGLLANTLAHQQACESGAFEAIFCRDALLQEGTHSSILFGKDGSLICPPLTRHILPSVTREVILALAGSESIPVTVRACRESEMAEFDEVLMLSTTVEIVPIIAVGDWRIGSGAPGPIARTLQSAWVKKIGMVE